MITVKLYTGQVLTFPDNTPEAVIRAAAERATQAAKSSSPSSKSSLDLSSLQGQSGERVGGPKLQQDADLGIKLKPQESAQEELSGRSPEFWRSVSGSPSSKAAEYRRQSELRIAEESGASAMASLGFEDRETHYYNPATDERVPKKRKTGNLPGPLDTGYRPESATDRLHEIYEAEGRPVPTSEELEARSEFVRGIPSRVMGSMAGLAIPFQAAESLGRGLREEAKNLVTGEHIGRPTGEGLHRGVRQGWVESPITRGAAVVQEEVVEPARQRYLDAAIRAGMSPESAALAETGQMVAGEAMNPGNYIGLEMLRTGAQMSRTAPAALARRSAQESVGGARALEEAGIVTGEYGRGSAPSEIAQAKAARSGDFLPGANEPLLYRDPAGYGGYKWKGVIPDAVRDLRDQPWRTYRNVDMEAAGLGRVPLERPPGPGPRPRNVEGRQPLPIKLVGGTPEDQARIGGLWDYASRRYPTIASRVSRVEIGPESYFEPTTGRLQLAPDANLGHMMHEMTHVAQEARGVFDRIGVDDVGVFEPAALRADDVYGRIPQPLPRKVVGGSGMANFRKRLSAEDGPDFDSAWEAEQREIARIEAENPTYDPQQEDYGTVNGTLSHRAYGIDKYSAPDLRVARELPSGEIITGKPGQIHSDLISDEELAAGTFSDNEMGYTLPDGRYMSRKEAADWISEQGRARQAWLDNENAAIESWSNRQLAKGRPEPLNANSNKVTTGQDMSERFASFLSRAGIEDPDLYYDLDPAQRAILDRQFAANDAGPDTVAWSAFLLEHNLRPDDYTSMSLSDRVKVESEFRMQMAHQAETPDPDAGLPDYFYDANSGGWKVEGSDEVFEKEWQAKQHREAFRAYGDRSSGSGWLNRLFGRANPEPAYTSASAIPSAPPVPKEPSRLTLTPQARIAPAESINQFRDKVWEYADSSQPLTVDDLPFELRDLPLSRWSNADPGRRIRGTHPAHWDFDRAGGYWRLGDDTSFYGDPDRGGRLPVAESFTPENPLILPDHQTGFNLLQESGWKPSEWQNSKYSEMHAAGGPWEDRYLNDFARSQGHDSIIILNEDGNGSIGVVKLNEGIVGVDRKSPYLDNYAGWAQELGGRDRLDQYSDTVLGRAGVAIDNSTSPQDLLRMADDIEASTGETLAADMLRERAGPLWRATTNKPYRVYADQGIGNAGNVGNPLAGQPIPPAIAPALPEEQAARAMGWLLPDGSPSPVGPTTRVQVPEYQFQTNIAAQLGGASDPQAQQIANYVIQQSDEVYRSIGPPQSWDTLEELATRAGTTKEDLLANSSHWQVMSPELRLRLLYVIKGNEEKIGGLQQKLVAGSATDADKADLLRLIDSRSDMVRLAAKTGSAYGRALNSLRMEARLALSDDQLLRQQLYRQYSKQIDADRPLLDALARLDPGNPEELQAFLRAVNRPSFREYVQEYWISSILSGPATHERNLIGNAVNAVMENAVIRPVAAGFDAARVAGAGMAGADRAIYLSETPAAVLGLTRGIRQGMRRGLEVMKRGYDPTTMSGKLYPVRSAFARSQNRVVREVVGPVVTMPLRLLAASDALFKTMNWTAEIHAQAARAASKAGLSGDAWAAEVSRLISNPTDDMIDAADDFALKATFNDEASAFGKAIMNLRDLPGLAEPESAIGRAGVETYRGIAGFVLPFIKIADRLMVRGFEYTPVGTIKSIGARQAGNFVESADLAARSAFGSVVMAYAASLAMEGRLTAAAPADEAEKAAFFGSGKQAWSVRTDDGLWIPYGGLQPVGTPFALAASFWKGWTENGEQPTDERIAWGVQQVGQYVTDQSYMDGLSKLIEAISGGKGQAGRAGADMITNTAWGFTPYSGLTRSIAKGVDPRVIDAEHVADRLWQNVPGVSLGMDARLTPWGEEVIPVGGRLRSGLAPGSILLPSKEKPSPLDQELDRLGMPLGYVGKTLSDRLGRGKSRGSWKLTPDEWYYYQQTAGRTTRKLLERLYSKEGYPIWDIERQREETEKAIGAAREYARIQTVRRHRGLGHV